MDRTSHVTFRLLTSHFKPHDGMPTPQQREKCACAHRGRHTEDDHAGAGASFSTIRVIIKPIWAGQAKARPGQGPDCSRCQPRAPQRVGLAGMPMRGLV